MLDIRFAAAALAKDGALVLPVAEGAPLAGLAAAADKALDGRLSVALKAARFTGKKGQSVSMLAPGAGLARVVAVGLGKAAALDAQGAEDAAGSALAPLLGGADKQAAIAADLPEGAKGLDAAAFAAALAMGARLRAYRFDRYRTTEKPDEKPALGTVTVLAADAARARAAFAPLARVADGVFLTRDLVSEPPNVLNPAEMARRCGALTRLGVKVEVLGPRDLRRLGFNTLLGVAQGSVNEPRVVVMRWNGAPRRGRGKGKGAAGPVAFVGKGVTFDTGGISLKPAGGMEDMKWDMAGAGAVIGLMAALAGRKAKVDAVGIVGLVENMPSGQAQRPGDVVKSLSGQTVEVLNTDAEGRLVLADCLWYCQDRFKPRFMIDLATLTGAIIISLGHEHAGLFANDDTLATQIAAAGKATGEACWRMPLGDAYDKQLKSDIADMKNIGGRPGGSITAAQFLQRFVAKAAWAHLDIAGMAWSSKDKPTVPKGATAFGVRLLDRLVAEHYEGR